METLILECPKCGTQVEATGEMLEDGIVQCTNPACRQPFRVELPTGRVLENRVSDSGRVVASGDEGSHPASRHGAAGAEETLIQTHPAMFRRHPFQFIGSLALALAGLAGLAYWGPSGMWLPAGVSAAVALFGVGVLVLWWLRVVSTTLTVTSERTILRKGILSRATSEVRHDDVRNLQVNQTFIERMLGVGDLAISSAGQDDLEIDVDGVARPEEIATMIRQRQG